ncbi:MAG: TRAP-type mannitol/chloroaromatic compound transport system permease small subunit [Woeseiaceae bacterium]
MNVDTNKISELLPHSDSLPETWLSALIGRAFNLLLRIVSWVWFVLIMVIVVNVVMRYAFGQGRIEFEELQWHLYAIGFLVGMATCMSSDSHIRVDVLHDRLPRKSQAWIELYGLLLLFLPFVLMVLIFSFPFVQYSWSIAEVSDAPGGLPFRWVIKSVLPLGMILLLAAGLRRLLRVSSFLFGAPAAIEFDSDQDVD